MYSYNSDINGQYYDPPDYTNGAVVKGGRGGGSERIRWRCGPPTLRYSAEQHLRRIAVSRHKVRSSAVQRQGNKFG